jgi:hypothetical protein
MPKIIIVRNQVYDWRRKEYVDEILPTLTVKRAGKYRGADADLVVGSHLVGAGSAQTWWDITTTGSPMIGEVQGTVDVGFLEAIGQETNLMDPNAPIAIQPGTFFVNIRSAGTATDYGCSFEGLERGGGAE